MIKFVIPSLLGAFFFLFPIRANNGITIPIGWLSDRLQQHLSSYLAHIVILVCVISVLLSLWFSIRRNSKFLGDFSAPFRTSSTWLVLRTLGLIFGLVIFFSTGPEFIWSSNTGQVVLNDLAKPIFTIFLVAGLLLPLLTDYGLMELLGTLLSKVFRTLFTLPGRASIDALASWMGSAPVGVLITSQQYNKGYYSGREAAVIATNFSVVSLPFCLLVANVIGIGHLFIPYYLAVVIAGVIAAIIVPRIWPLRSKKDLYSHAGKQLHEETSDTDSLLRAGIAKAKDKAQTGPTPKQFVKNGLLNVFDIWFGLMPPLLFIATLGLIIAEYTPVLVWISYPLVPVLNLLQVPEATAAAPAFFAGFADMFLPAVLGKDIESELTRFVIAGVSITQLVYMSEVGLLLLKSAIPIRFGDLIAIFCLRTVISLPIITGIAHLTV